MMNQHFRSQMMFLFVCVWSACCLKQNHGWCDSIRFAANVLLAVLMAILCSLRMTTDSEQEENEMIQHMVRNMRHH